LSPIEPLFPVEPLSTEGAKGPSVNTDQGKMSGDKVPTGNKGFIAD
jgi:hypothetical protein